jgi:hypothetical protein
MHLQLSELFIFIIPPGKTIFPFRQLFIRFTLGCLGTFFKLRKNTKTGTIFELHTKGAKQN